MKTLISLGTVSRNTLAQVVCGAAQDLAPAIVVNCLDSSNHVIQGFKCRLSSSGQPRSSGSQPADFASCEGL